MNEDFTEYQDDDFCFLKQNTEFEEKQLDHTQSACGVFLYTCVDDRPDCEYDTLNLFDNKRKLFPYNPKKSIAYNEIDSNVLFDD